MLSVERWMWLTAAGLAISVGLWVPLASASKIMLSDEELERISAGGEPTIIQTSGTASPIDFLEAGEASLNLADGAQVSLSALILNNVVGENQLATGLNIQGATNNTEGSQDVTITQSWGSIKDITVVSTSAPGGTGCAAGAEKCFNNKGGNASSSQMMLSKMADVIIESGGTGSPIAVTESPQYALVFGVGAQANLSALVVNNVVGLNQVSTGLNIQGSGINTSPLSLSGAGGSTAGRQIGQRIAVEQFRGTPAGRPGF